MSECSLYVVLTLSGPLSEVNLLKSISLSLSLVAILSLPLSLSLSLSLFPSYTDTFSFLDHSHLYLNILAESMGDVISSACHHDNQEAVHWLAESLELVFGCLRKRRETCHLTEKERGPTGGEINFIPKSAFQSFKTFILNSVDFLDIILQVSVLL